jgi:hypothetical protein
MFRALFDDDINVIRKVIEIEVYYQMSTFHGIFIKWFNVIV